MSLEAKIEALTQEVAMLQATISKGFEIRLSDQQLKSLGEKPATVVEDEPAPKPKKKKVEKAPEPEPEPAADDSLLRVTLADVKTSFIAAAKSLGKTDTVALVAETVGHEIANINHVPEDKLADVKAALDAVL